MKSVRLDECLEAKLQEAARVTGEPVSTIMRRAIETYCDTILEGRLDRRLADVIGLIHGGGGRAQSTGKAFTELLRKRRRDLPR